MVFAGKSLLFFSLPFDSIFLDCIQNCAQVFWRSEFCGATCYSDSIKFCVLNFGGKVVREEKCSITYLVV